MSNSTAVEHKSEWFIKPKYTVEESSNHPCHLGPWDLVMLSVQYIQKGLLFAKPSDSSHSINLLLDTLKDSLSTTLVHFYPLAGRLATLADEDQHESLVFIDPNKGSGARFIHATLHMTMSDILSPTDVPLVVQSLFDHHKALNHDGHTRPLLSVQVTELIDGIFIGVSINHVVADGASYWHFWNTWSEIHRLNTNGKQVCISNPPVHTRFVPNGYGPTLTLPYTHPDEFLRGYEPPPLRERIFHFSSESIAKLKAKANEESNNNSNKISSFQALSALVWRSIVRANRLPANQVTNCRLAVNNRHRLDPPLPQYYFGNSFNVMNTSAIVGELLEHSLGWAASMLNESIPKHGDKVREFLNGWLESRFVYEQGRMFDPNNMVMGSSPRFDMYGNEFGFGKAVAVRSGCAHKFVGKVTSYPGCEGGGSVDLEICLPPQSMTILESDQEFMGAVSF